MEIPVQNRPRTRSGQGLRAERKSLIDEHIKNFAQNEDAYLKNALAEWMTQTTGTSVFLPLSTSLSNGVILCKLIEKVCDTKVKGLHTDIKQTSTQAGESRAVIFRTENINLFLQACKDNGIRNQNLFTPEQLFSGEERSVVHCLLAILRIADKKGMEISARLRSLAQLEETVPIVRKKSDYMRLVLPVVALIANIAALSAIVMAFVSVWQIIELDKIGTYSFAFMDLIFVPNTNKDLKPVQPVVTQYPTVAEKDKTMTHMLHSIGVMMMVMLGLLGLAGLLLLISVTIEIILIRCIRHRAWSSKIAGLTPFFPISASIILVTAVGIWTMMGPKECKNYVSAIYHNASYTNSPGPAFWLCIVAAGSSLLSGVLYRSNQLARGPDSTKLLKEAPTLDYATIERTL
mmetsp:Transcript_11933/g.21777  ORF Transcript_11933/g.21777 Transcript_11933/m.21777 type:complete len:404 (-) Transcript_11933:275-1486(-)